MIYVAYAVKHERCYLLELFALCKSRYALLKYLTDLVVCIVYVKRCTKENNHQMILNHIKYIKYK